MAIEGEEKEHDEVEEYDREHGDPAKADFAREPGLTQAGNKPPSGGALPFKNLHD